MCERGHIKHSAAVARAGSNEYLPAAQGTQFSRAVLSPVRERWCPAGQGRQTALVAPPTVAEVVPSRQRWQSLMRDAGAPTGRNVPARHSVHAVLPRTAATVPGSHTWHVSTEAAPGALENLPLAHLVQTDAREAPTLDEYEPRAH